MFFLVEILCFILIVSLYFTGYNSNKFELADKQILAIALSGVESGWTFVYLFYALGFFTAICGTIDVISKIYTLILENNKYLLITYIIWMFMSITFVLLNLEKGIISFIFLGIIIFFGLPLLCNLIYVLVYLPIFDKEEYEEQTETLWVGIEWILKKLKLF